jgi:hypothetical protein
MGQVETIALWLGLVVGIASVTLSIWATVFAVWVYRESHLISDKTLQSLQRIEGTVERQSRDTNNLIKAAWDKMLGAVPSAWDLLPPDRRRDAARVISGLAAEAHDDAANLTNAASGRVATREEINTFLDDFVERTRDTLTNNISDHAEGTHISQDVDRILKRLNNLPETAQELIRAIYRGGALSRQQYQELSKNEDIKPALRMLRQSGLLVPVLGLSRRGQGEKPEQEYVYYFPPAIIDAIGPAIEMMPRESALVAPVVEDALRDAGYPGTPDVQDAVNGRSRSSTT